MYNKETFPYVLTTNQTNSHLSILNHMYISKQSSALVVRIITPVLIKAAGNHDEEKILPPFFENFHYIEVRTEQLHQLQVCRTTHQFAGPAGESNQYILPVPKWVATTGNAELCISTCKWLNASTPVLHLLSSAGEGKDHYY